MTADDLNIVALVKSEQRYVFAFRNTESELCEILRALGRFASNPELDFTWYDAAVLSQRARGMMKEGVGSRRLF